MWGKFILGVCTYHFDLLLRELELGLEVLVLGLAVLELLVEECQLFLLRLLLDPQLLVVELALLKLLDDGIDTDFDLIEFLEVSERSSTCCWAFLSRSISYSSFLMYCCSYWFSYSVASSLTYS